MIERGKAQFRLPTSETHARIGPLKEGGPNKSARQNANLGPRRRNPCRICPYLDCLLALVGGYFRSEEEDWDL